MSTSASERWAPICEARAIQTHEEAQQRVKRNRMRQSRTWMRIQGTRSNGRGALKARSGTCARCPRREGDLARTARQGEGRGGQSLTMATLTSVRVGTPRVVGSGDEVRLTAFYKTPVEGPAEVRFDNIVGDRQADPLLHGGRDKAICVYANEHYALWANELVESSCGPGWFGENFTVAGQTESTVCIGDIYRVGTCLVEVAQPRGPCWKLAKRWNRPDLPKLTVQTGRTGWYFRVLAEGSVELHDCLILCERPHARWTIEAVNRLTYARPELRTAAELLDLGACAALSSGWRERVFEALDRLPAEGK